MRFIDVLRMGSGSQAPKIKTKPEESKPVIPVPEEGDYPGPHRAEVTGIEFFTEPVAHSVTIYRVWIRNDRYSGGHRVATYRQRAYSQKTW